MLHGLVEAVLKDFIIYHGRADFEEGSAPRTHDGGQIVRKLQDNMESEVVRECCTDILRCYWQNITVVVAPGSSWCRLRI